MEKSIIRWSSCALLMFAACNDDDAQSGIPNLTGRAAFAVELTNFTDSSAVVLFDGDGKLLNPESPNYISSGTTTPGLSAALPDDIALPTNPCGSGEALTVVARQGGDFVLQVDLEESKVERQIPTQSAGGAVAFSSNPQDILCLGDGRAVISRLGLNAGVPATDLNRGDDLVVVDLEKGTIVSRVDLSAVYGQVTTTDFDTQAEVVEDTFASPGKIVRVGPKHALVGTSKLSAAFNANLAGGVVLLDLEKFGVTPVALDGFANCGEAYVVPGRPDAALVQCAGGYYGNPENSGLVLLSVNDGKATVEHTFKVAVEGTSLSSNPTPIDETRVIATTSNFVMKPDGSFAPDKAYVVDLVDGSFSELFAASAPGDIGSGAMRNDTGLILIPDASTGVRLFLLDGELSAKGMVALDPVVPARTVRPLYDF